MAQKHRRGALSGRNLQLAGLILALCVGNGCGGDEEKGAQFNQGSLMPASTATDSIALADSTSLLTTGEIEMPSLEAVPEAKAESSRTGAQSSASHKAGQIQANETKAASTEGVFSVQIGSFRSADNARALVARVTELGYRPEVEVASLGGQTYHRVVVSGLVSRQEAERCGEHLRSAEGITYLIRHR